MNEDALTQLVLYDDNTLMNKRCRMERDTIAVWNLAQSWSILI